MKHLLAILLVLAFPALAQADETPLRELDRADEAQLWSAVGRVNIGQSGFCTGALIEAQLVLTAAHCFFDRDTGQRVDSARVRFIAGWNDGTAQAVRGARRVLIDPAYEYTGADKSARVSHDLALIELDQPITSNIRPFERYYSPQNGDSVSVVSYAQDRSEIPSIQDNCSIIDKEADVLVLTCSVNFGASGSPIFVMSNARPKIASVVSAMADMNGERVALAVALDGTLDELINQLKQTDPVFLSRKPGGSLAEQLDRGGGSDLFTKVP